MTCRLLRIRDNVADVVDYWVQSRVDCIEMADLWRFGGFSVWMEAWK